jgi:FkbM family methyltransferase
MARRPTAQVLTTSEMADGMTKLGYPSARSVVGELRAQFKNWLTLGVLSWVALPTRWPPRAGWPRLARLPVNVHLRNGLEARCRLDEFQAFIEVWVYRQYEVDSLRWEDVRTIVDVGANIGAATLWFASRAPMARIVAVEPASEIVPWLVRNVEQNNLGNRVEVMPIALGGMAGMGYLEPSSSSVSASVRLDRFEGGIPVPIVPLYELLENAGIRELDLLKLDCEGAEFEILGSSDDAVLRRSRVIVGEYHSTSRAAVAGLMARLEEAGFRVTFAASDAPPDDQWGLRGLGVFKAVRI